jgi:hypothetical protein
MMRSFERKARVKWHVEEPRQTVTTSLASTADPFTLAGVVLLMGLVGLAAAYLRERRFVLDLCSPDKRAAHSAAE